MDEYGTAEGDPLARVRQDVFEFVARKVHARGGHTRRARYWMLSEGRKLSSSKHPQQSPSGG